MLNSLLMMLREGLGRPGRRDYPAYLARIGSRQGIKHVWLRVPVAVAASLLAGIATYFSAGQLESRAEEIFEGIAMLTVAGVLTWNLDDLLDAQAKRRGVARNVRGLRTADWDAMLKAAEETHGEDYSCTLCHGDGYNWGGTAQHVGRGMMSWR